MVEYKYREEIRMTLTKHQRYTRKKQKDSHKDFKHTTGSTGKPAIHATQRKVSARVTDEAADRLRDEAKTRGITQSALLERILTQDIPRYASHTGELGTNRYHWDTPKEPKVRRRRGKVGGRAINLWVGSTAANKLEIHADTTGESKSRLVDRLIREHRFLTQEEHERNRAYAERMGRMEQEWRERHGIG